MSLLTCWVLQMYFVLSFFFFPRDFAQPFPSLFSFHMWIEVFAMEAKFIVTALLKIKCNNIISLDACWISKCKQTDRNAPNNPKLIDTLTYSCFYPAYTCRLMLLWLLTQIRLWIHPAKDLNCTHQVPVLVSHHTEPSTQGTKAWLQIKRRRVARMPIAQDKLCYKTLAAALWNSCKPGSPPGSIWHLCEFKTSLFWGFFKILSSHPPPSPHPLFFSGYNAPKWCKNCVTAYQANGCTSWWQGDALQALDLDLKACEKALRGRTVALLLPQLTTGNSLEQSRPQKHIWISTQKELVDSFQKKRSGLNRETEMLRRWRYSHIPADSQPGNLILLCKFTNAGSESFWYIKDRLLMYQSIRDFCFIRQTDNDVWIFLKTWGHWLGSTLKFHWGKRKLKI